MLKNQSKFFVLFVLNTLHIGRQLCKSLSLFRYIKKKKSTLFTTYLQILNTNDYTLRSVTLDWYSSLKLKYLRPNYFSIRLCTKLVYCILIFDLFVKYIYIKTEI